jgi:hypothetical protein
VASCLNSVAYGNGLFVAVGDDGVFLTSEDGYTWIRQSFLQTIKIVSIACGKDTFFALAEGVTGGVCFKVDPVSKISLIS